MWNLFSVSFLFDEDSKCKTHCNISVETVHTQFLFLIYDALYDFLIYDAL